MYCDKDCRRYGRAFTSRDATRRDKRSQHWETPTRRNNIFASWASSGRLHLLQKSYCHDRAVFIVSLRGQYRRAGVFGQRLAWGDGRNTASGLRIRLRSPYPMPYPRESIVTVLGHFSCSLFWGITPRDRDPRQRAVHVPWKMVGTHWTRERKEVTVQRLGAAIEISRWERYVVYRSTELNKAIRRTKVT